MRLLVYTLFFLAYTVNWSMGGEWYQKIYYQDGNSEKIGYLKCDYWINDFVPPKNKVTFKQFYLNHADLEDDSITVYTDLIDQSHFSKAATFPIHPFEINPTHFVRFEINELEINNIGKLYVRDDYHIKMLTPLFDSDTTWIYDKPIKSLPLGDEVGCRLEIYEFTASPSNRSYIDRLVSLYLIDDKKRMEKLLQIMNSLHIIVVELCGC